MRLTALALIIVGAAGLFLCVQKGGGFGAVIGLMFLILTLPWLAVLLIWLEEK